jgi:hypothetical protein
VPSVVPGTRPGNRPGNLPGRPRERIVNLSFLNPPTNKNKNKNKAPTNKNNAPTNNAPSPSPSSAPAWQTGLGLGPNASFITAQKKLKRLPQGQNTSQVYRLMRNAVQNGAFRPELLQAYSKIYNANNYNSGMRAYEVELERLKRNAKNKDGNPVVLYNKTQKAHLNRSLEYLKHKTGQYV